MQLWDIHAVDIDRLSCLCELCSSDMIHRENDLDTLLCCLLEEGRSCLEIVILDKGLADLVALYLEECICHASADYDCVACADK